MTNYIVQFICSSSFECPLIAHNGLRSLIAVSVTLCLMPAWYSQVDSTGFRSSSLKTVPVFRTP